MWGLFLFGKMNEEGGSQMLDYSKRKCYGFIKNHSNEFIVNEIEATNVKLIFECFLNGMSLSEISKELYSQGINSPSGKDTWSRKVISSTLSNEKYRIYGIVDAFTFESAQVSKSKRTGKATDNVEITNEVAIDNTLVVSTQDVQVCEISKTPILHTCMIKSQRVCFQIAGWLIGQFRFLHLNSSPIQLYDTRSCQLYQGKHINPLIQILDFGQGLESGNSYVNAQRKSLEKFPFLAIEKTHKSFVYKVFLGYYIVLPSHKRPHKHCVYAVFCYVVTQLITHSKYKT